MAGYKPRRPAQLELEQLDLIEGSADIAYQHELAHISAQAIVPLVSSQYADVEVTQRVLELLRQEGVDTLAETWVTAPADSLPGVLWRGYLLSEWIRRDAQTVLLRYQAAVSYFAQTEPQRSSLVPTPAELGALWQTVWLGDYREDFAAVLRKSARFLDFLGSVLPVWIDDEHHSLATAVTLRETALLRTAQEFVVAGQSLMHGRLC